MNIWLLTHTEELKKSTGTGKLVKDTLGLACKIVEWSRVAPDQEILDLDPNNTLLIYSNNEAETTSCDKSLSTIENIIIIDGTWQQAQKMYNKSPYLKKFGHYEICGLKSVYNKRRNQKTFGLCTVEVAIYLLNEIKHPLTSTLQSKFDEFNQ